MVQRPSTIVMDSWNRVWLSSPGTLAMLYSDPAAPRPKPASKRPPLSRSEGGGFLSQFRREMQRRNQHCRSKSQSRGLGGDIAGYHQRCRAKSIPGEMVLRHPGAFEPQLFAQDKLFRNVVKDLLGLGPFGPRARGRKGQNPCLSAHSTGQFYASYQIRPN